jgi:hypothetical protein
MDDEGVSRAAAFGADISLPRGRHVIELFRKTARVAGIRIATE